MTNHIIQLSQWKRCRKHTTKAMGYINEYKSHGFVLIYFWAVEWGLAEFTCTAIGIEWFHIIGFKIDRIHINNQWYKKMVLKLRIRFDSYLLGH